MGTLGTLIATRNLFVNSDDPEVGECRDVTYNLPQGLVMCNENQHMRITLNAFTMRNSWYRVNQYNNTFFLLAKYTEASTYHSVRCTYGGTAPLPPAGSDGALGWPAVSPATVAGVGAVVSWKPDSVGSTSGVLVFSKSAGVAPATGQVLTHVNGSTYTVNADNAASRVNGFRIRIPPANYTSFEALCNAIEAQLQLIPTEALGGTSFPYQCVNWDSETNLIKIVPKQGPNAPDLKFVCYTINPYVANRQSLVTQMVRSKKFEAFQNSYELVGGCFQKTTTTGTFEEQFDATRSLFVISTSKQHTSSYNATLQTEENIYLRTNLHSTSYQSAGFDTGASRYPQIVSSRILAKIPLNNPQFAVQKSRTYPLDQKLSVFAGSYGNSASVEQGVNEGETATSGNNITFTQTFTVPSGTYSQGDTVRQAQGAQGQPAFGEVKTTATASTSVDVTCELGMFDVNGSDVSMKAEQTLTVATGTYEAPSAPNPAGKFSLKNAAGTELAFGTVKTTVTGTSVEVRVLTGAFAAAAGNVLTYTSPTLVESTVAFTAATAIGADIEASAISEVPASDPSAQISIKVFCGEFKTTDAGGPITIGGVSAYCFAVSQKDNEYSLYTYERPYELIQYCDNGNNMYSIMLESKKVSSIQLFITDSFGRLWPEISKAQIECNAMPFTASLRVDVFQE